MGEHADARELASLYISKGVPIYPAPRGHAYHTLAWRMGLELSSSSSSTTTTSSTGGEDGRGEENDGQRTGNVNNPVMAAVASAATLDGAEERMRIGTDDEIIVGDINANESIALLSPPIMDAYYSSRYLDGAADDGSITNDMHRNVGDGGGAGQRRPPNGRGRNRRRRHNNAHSLREHLGLSMTYVEEKALFWKRKKGIEDTLTTAATPTSRPFAPRQPLLHHVPPLMNHDAAIAAPQAAPMGIVASSSSLLSNSVPDLRSLAVEELSVLEHDYNNNNIMPLYAPPSATYVPAPSSPPSHQLRRHATMVMNDVVVAPKLTMRVHRHLADQHFFGSPSVDDEKGGMIAGEFGRRNESLNELLCCTRLIVLSHRH